MKWQMLVFLVAAFGALLHRLIGFPATLPLFIVAFVLAHNADELNRNRD